MENRLRRLAAHEASGAEEPQPNMAQFTYSRVSHLLRLSAIKASASRTPTEINNGIASCLQFIRCQVRLIFIFVVSLCR